MKLSKNFSLSEFTKSAKAEELGIDNTPSSKEIENLFESLIKKTSSKGEEILYWDDHWNRGLSKVHLSYA